MKVEDDVPLPTGWVLTFANEWECNYEHKTFAYISTAACFPSKRLKSNLGRSTNSRVELCNLGEPVVFTEVYSGFRVDCTRQGVFEMGVHINHPTWT